MVRNHARKNDARRRTVAGQGPHRRAVHLASRIPTGLIPLDQLLGGGLRRGKVSVVAARTAMGKSMLAMSFVRHCSFRLHRPALLASLEMDDRELFYRVLAAETGVPTQRLHRGNFTPDQVQYMKGSLNQNPLHMTGHSTLAEVAVEAVAERCDTVRAREGGLDLVVVDYLSLMRGPMVSRGDREQEIEHIVAGYADLAREYEAAVLIVNQLTRAPMHRTDHRPRLEDLQHADTLRRHGDAFILLHRDQYYRQADDRWYRQSPDPALYAEDVFPRIGLPETIVQRADLSVAHHPADRLRTATIGVDLSRCRFYNEPPVHM